MNKKQTVLCTNQHLSYIPHAHRGKKIMTPINNIIASLSTAIENHQASTVVPQKNEHYAHGTQRQTLRALREI